MTTPIIDPSMLTEEQKYKILALYKANKVVIECYGNVLNEETIENKLLERLFGKEFFNEKGE